MNELLASALAYAQRGWRIVPLWPLRQQGGKWVCGCRSGEKCGTSAGKHPRIKTGRDHAAGSIDAAQITAWWTRWPTAGIGIITGAGSGIIVADLDSARGLAFLKGLVDKHGSLPPTAIARSGREGVGAHLYFAVKGDCGRLGSYDGFDIRADGGFIVAPPSLHYSGNRYAWLEWREPAEAPAWLLDELRGEDRPLGSRARGAGLVGGGQPGPRTDRAARVTQGDFDPAKQIAPPAARGKGKGLAARALGGMRRLEAEDGDLLAAAALVGNQDLPWDAWNRLGMACWNASGGSEAGLSAFVEISRKSSKFNPDTVLERWNHYAKSPPTDVGFGALVYAARQTDPDWDPPSRGRAAVPPETPPPQHQSAAGAGDAAPTLHAPHPLPAPVVRNLLKEMNEKHAVIGDLGGKCLVMSWVRSKVDEQIEIPSFQSTKHFSDRYANQLIAVKSLNKVGEWEEKHHPLGAYWLKWDKRKTHEGIDLVPNAAKVLPGNVLNLWDGFACQPRPGEWGRMRDHIERVLCGGNSESALYVLRWAAWTVQHPGEQAEVALVFRGGKGTGKGTFAVAMRRIFGQHGLHISNGRHLTGNFNAHLRSCCLLFADEAYWAGDKQGESSLKTLITERGIMIEQKGIDATMWRNMLHVIMAANAEWVIPASHDERRYAVFDVDPTESQNSAHFDPLYEEMRNGGLEAMLYALLNVDLGGWHPRQGCVTAALQEQKARTLDPRWEWWEGILQSGLLPHYGQTADLAMSGALLESLRTNNRRAQDVSQRALGLFLRDLGAGHQHRRNGDAWRFPALPTMRHTWEKRFGTWPWDSELKEWRMRDHGLQ